MDQISNVEVSESFEYYLSVLKNHLSYVEDTSFRWSDVNGILIIQLKNTDSLNKERDASHATQIQITSESMPIPGMSKTEDFFPTLTMNTSFKSWRILLDARINRLNIASLENESTINAQGWLDDSIQIRRRLLNESADNPSNPALQICYGNDLMPLREKLQVDDYLVFVKRRLADVYEVFGVRSDVGLGSGKRMFKSAKASNDSTVFSIRQLTGEKEDRETATKYLDLVDRKQTGTNVLLYGVPGSGKSWTIEHEYCKQDSHVERLVFHPDYTYSDFIGQILPVVDANGQVSYKFTPGPFTNILEAAYKHPQEEYILVIEEINRGNAPAIFGEVFQLLDRKVEISDIVDDKYPIGTSEYEITNANIARIVYGNPEHKVRIPSNLSIIGTMNTSDQNVFTLDTAFQRRWEMRLIENNFENVDEKLAKAEILDTGISWEVFCTEINDIIVGNNVRMSSSEDKRLGAYFVRLMDLQKDPRMGDLTVYDALRKKESAGTLSEDEKQKISEIREAMKKNRRFPEKVIKYLWDDAFKFNREVIFETTEYRSLESVIRAFMYAEGIQRFKIFKQNVVDALQNPESEQ